MRTIQEQARNHKKRRLRQGQFLYLALHLHTREHRRLIWIKIQAEDLLELLHEQQIIHELDP